MIETYDLAILHLAKIFLFAQHKCAMTAAPRRAPEAFLLDLLEN